MKKIIMAVFMATVLLAACSKDNNQSEQERKLKGLWKLGAVVTRITYSDGHVLRDSTNYSATDNFSFNSDGTYYVVVTRDGETNQGAGSWSEGADGKITIVTGYDTSNYQTYVVSNLTTTNLQFYNSRVDNGNTVETWFYLNK